MKRIFTFGLLVAAAFALTNCAQKESYAPVQEETKKYVDCQVVVKLPAQTKTYNDSLSTMWSPNDSICLIATYYKNVSESWLPNYKLFTDPCDHPYVYQGNGAFLGKFEQEIVFGALSDWLGGSFEAVYPYTKDGSYTVPASTVQNGYNSTAHLAGANCPLKGEVSLSLDQKYADMWSDERPYNLPEIVLEHVTSVIKVEVKNNTSSDFYVNEVDFLVGGAVKAATIVENAGALASGDVAEVYVVVEAGTYSDLSFTVNGEYVKNISASNVPFKAGVIKPVLFVIE